MLKRCRQLGVELVECSGVDFISMERTATLYYLERVAALRKESRYSVEPGGRCPLAS